MPFSTKSIFLIPLLLGQIEAQPVKRCDIVGVPSSTSGGTQQRNCLDITRINGDTLKVPSNATRFAQDGLALCKSAVREGGLADIVYVLDQSGSMYAQYAHINRITHDTTFLEAFGGCQNMSAADTVGRISVVFETGTQSVKLLNPAKNLTGCTDFAGDPYGQRGIAFKNAIQYQSEVSPKSTAGYLGFNSAITDAQKLLELNSANLAILKSRVVMRQGGTNYRPPLDTAKRWLTNRSLIQTPKQAIVFLSDGKPYDAYLDLLDDGKMPPIYGIFLGNKTADYSKLRELSNRTGGQFYLIPPQDPDSLKSVVRLILNEILKTYEPVSATLTNASISPIQTSTAASVDFTSQTNGNWRVNLNAILGLGKESLNAITLETKFRETGSGLEETRTTRFWIRTTDTPANSNRILSDSLLALSCYEASKITLVDLAGNSFSGNLSADTSLRVKLRTGPDEANSQQASVATLVVGDQINTALSSGITNNDSSLFSGNINLALLASGAATKPTYLEFRRFDTVTALWRHPRDTQDSATLRVAIRPANKIAQIHFSLSPDGAAISEIAADKSEAYVVLADQPSLIHTASISLSSVSVGTDLETIELSETEPGIYSGKFTLKPGLKINGNGSLEVSPGGDQIRASYHDPIYGDSAFAQVGFDQAPQEIAQIAFVDAQGNDIPPGSLLTPVQLAGLKLKYSDDYALGTLNSKISSVKMTAYFDNHVLYSDRESITLPIEAALGNSRGRWTTPLSFLETAQAHSGDGIINWRDRSELIASVITHDNSGHTENSVVSTHLFVAFADSTPSIGWSDTDTVLLPGKTEHLLLTLHDQDYSTVAVDTAFLSALCPSTGDSVTQIPLVEKGRGDYRGAILERTTGAPNPEDRLLTCSDGSDIVLQYKDPLYQNLFSVVVPQVATPQATAPGHAIQLEEVVSLATKTTGAQIFYSIMGSLPDTASSRYNAPLRISNTTKLQSFATLKGYRKSRLQIDDYSKAGSHSRLEILDANGNTISTDGLTDAATAVTFRLTTTQGGLGVVKVQVKTLHQGDFEEGRLLDMRLQTGAYVFTDQLPLNSGPLKVGDDTLQIASTDTLVVSWENPENPSDKASDTVVIKPHYTLASIWFSTIADGVRTSEYANTQDTAYLNVTGRPHLVNPAITVRSLNLNTDEEVISLNEISNGHYVGKIALRAGITKSKSNRTLEVSAAGDQLTATFIDPIYGDSAIGNVGFDQGVEETGNLFFTDSAGNVYAPNLELNPSVGKLFLSYRDDWSAGIATNVDSLNGFIMASILKQGSPFATDTELIVFRHMTTQGSRGYWEAQISIRDTLPTAIHDGLLQTAFLGKITASIATHNNIGVADGNQAVAQIQLAKPNRQPTFTVVDENGLPPSRESKKIVVTVAQIDSGYPNLSAPTLQIGCIQSGDQVDSILLNPTLQNGNAQYQTSVTKQEGTGLSNIKDTVLTCRINDVITITYKDPTHNTKTTTEVEWSDDTKPSLWFSRQDDSIPISNLSDEQAHQFGIWLKARSPARDSVDKLDVALTAPSGEKETVTLTETSAFSGLFKGTVSFLFQKETPKPNNGLLEGIIDVNKTINFTLVNASFKQDADLSEANITLNSQFQKASRAWILDENFDGAADKIVIAFDTPLSALPAENIEAWWNEKTDLHKKTIKPTLQTLSPSGRELVLDLKTSPWEKGLTGKGLGEAAQVELPNNSRLAGQSIQLVDSVGPIPLKAFKKPSDLQTVIISGDEKHFTPDTLEITVSEPIKSLSSLKTLFRFSPGCSGNNQSLTILAQSEPTLDEKSQTYTVLVDNSSGAKLPLNGDCIYLESDGRYTDLNSNIPSPVPVVLSGTDPRLSIRDVRGYPPVAGFDAEDPAFFLVNNESRNDRDGRFSNERGGNWQVIWISPAGFQSNNPMDSYLPSSPQEEPRNEGENTFPTPMPSNLGVVQVLTTKRYVAQVSIFDNLGHFVRNFRQAFGYRGELRNPYRSTEKGLASFLVWDLMDSQGQKVGQGVYVWKITFAFSEGLQEVKTIRTGVMRQ